MAAAFENIPDLIQGRPWSPRIPWRIHLLLDHWAPQGMYGRPLPSSFVFRKAAPKVTFLFAGDLALHRWTDETSAEDVFGEVEPVFSGVDFRVLNLESVLTDQKEPMGTLGTFLRAPPRAVSALEYLGVDAVSLANNHVLDHGSEGVAESTKVLETRGISCFGLTDVLAAQQDHVHSVPGSTLEEVNGITVGLWAATDHFGGIPEVKGLAPVWAHGRELETGVRRLRSICDIVVVHLHWGYEFVMYPLLWHRDLARRLVEAGAQIVCCHHAHVVMGVERWGDGIIAHGLGNFFFGRASKAHPLGSYGLLLRVSADDQGILSADVVTVKADPLGRIRLEQEAPPGFDRLCRGLADDRFLARVQGTRVEYELLQVAKGLAAYGSAGDRARLLERKAFLSAPRQEWLTREAEASNDPPLRELGAWLQGLRSLPSEALVSYASRPPEVLSESSRGLDARCLAGRLP